MKYLSFSLWGDKELYCIGAIKNAELVNEVYPGWKMLVYYDQTVPELIIQELVKKDVVCIDMTDSKLYGMFWRFLAADISDCEYVVFRDADSRISKREFLSVEEWIKSKKSIHVMRDHPAHGIPYGNNQLGILGGMWGIKGGLVPMTDMVNKFNENKKLTYGSDQTFLRSIYFSFQNDRETHDPFFEKKDFPIIRENYRFVGERIGVNEIPLNDDWKVLINYK